MDKKYILVLLLIIGAVFVVYSFSKFDKAYPAGVSEESTSDLKEGEELSKYFTGENAEETTLPLPTVTPGKSKKCNLGDLTVEEGTVIDGSTCIVD